MAEFQNQNWFRKFFNAFRGVLVVARSQKSFWVHSLVAILVLIIAIVLRVSWVEGVILGACVAMVLTAEMLNSSIEFLSRKVSRDESPLIRDSLDAAAGAVLIASLGAAIIGLLVFVPRFMSLFAESP